MTTEASSITQTDARTTSGRIYGHRLLAVLVTLLLLVAGFGTVATANAATPSAKATAPPVSQQLAVALAEATKVAADHKTPSVQSLQQIGNLASTLLRDTPRPSTSCRTAIAAAEHLTKDRLNHTKLTGDLKAAAKAPNACVTTTTPQYVGGTVVDANGHPAAGILVSIDVEYVVGYSGEEDTATTGGNGHFTFTDLPVSEVQPWWKFLSPTATFSYNGGQVTLSLDALSTSNPASFSYRMDGNTSVRHDTVLLAGGQNLCAAAPSLFPLSVTFKPLSPLADGSAGAAGTLSFSQADICDGLDFVRAGIGFWFVSNAQYANGQPAGVSIDGGSTYQSGNEVFNELSGTQWAVTQWVYVQ